MVEPKFEIGDKLKSYVATWNKGFLGGHWKIEGEDASGGKFSVTYSKGEQHMKHTGAKCLNYMDVTNG